MPAETRRRTPSQISVLLLTLVLAMGAGALTSVRQASASTASGGRSTIAALEQRIAADGATAKRLVARYDADEARETAIRARLIAAERELKLGRAAKAELGRELRQIAIETYVNAGSGGLAGLLKVPNDLSGIAAVYTAIATDQLSMTVTTYEADARNVEVEESVLRREQAAVEAVLRQLLPDRNAAEAAVAQDEVLLRSAKGNLRTALAVDATRDAAADAAAERDLARQTVVVSAGSLDPVPAPSASPPAGPSGYVNPLRAVSALSPERIDQGVDYSGFGPIYAIGAGTVLSTVNGGWPGGTYITYRLDNGPAAGLVVYAAEDIEPLVQVGETVTSNTVLGTVYEGPDGIETGWADNGSGDTMARVASQFFGWNSTAFGANFSQLLVSLGAPGGIPQNHPFTGVLPAAWPTW